MLISDGYGECALLRHKISTERKCPQLPRGICAVTKSTTFPRLHIESQVNASETSKAQPGVGSRLQTAYQAATGWSCQFQQAADRCPAEGLRLSASTKHDSAEDAIELWKARDLASAISDLLSELESTRDTLRRREAELAAGVPVKPRRREEEHLAVRLEAILRGGAEALGCQASGLYLLDDATTRLTLRSAWGLPKPKFLEPPRPLAEAFADLEAIVGHAVVIEDASLLPHWRVPESFPAAVCVPVSSPTDPLGTLWFFASETRDFSEEQTNLAEMVAGRIASELQREMLLNECVSAKRADREQLHTTQWQQDHLPNVTPLLDDWQVAGWVADSDEPAAGFYDWFVPPDGSLAIAIGSGAGAAVESALSSAAVQAAVRSHANYARSASELVERVNETIWFGSAGGHFSSLAYAAIQSEDGGIDLVAAGNVLAFLLRDDEIQLLRVSATQLGMEPDLPLPGQSPAMQRNDLLVLMPAADDVDGVLQILEDGRKLPAKKLAESVQRAAGTVPFGLVLRRTR